MIRWLAYAIKYGCLGAIALICAGLLVSCNVDMYRTRPDLLLILWSFIALSVAAGWAITYLDDH